jgi:hypothetical protein
LKKKSQVFFFFFYKQKRRVKQFIFSGRNGDSDTRNKRNFEGNSVSQQINDIAVLTIIYTSLKNAKQKELPLHFACKKATQLFLFWYVCVKLVSYYFLFTTLRSLCFLSTLSFTSLHASSFCLFYHSPFSVWWNVSK